MIKYKIKRKIVNCEKIVSVTSHDLYPPPPCHKLSHFLRPPPPLWSVTYFMDGPKGDSLWDVSRATLVAKLTYASPAWWGYTSETQKRRLHRLLIKLQRCGFLPAQFDSMADLCSAADDALFRSVLSNEKHVLHPLLPPIKSTGYDLRTRAHNRIIPRADARMRRNFIFRMLYHGIF